jgi:hypothetical protein
MTANLDTTGQKTSSKASMAMVQVGRTWMAVSRLEYGEDFALGVTEGHTTVFPMGSIGMIETPYEPALTQATLQQYLQTLPLPLWFIEHTTSEVGWILSITQSFVEVATEGSRGWRPISTFGPIKLIPVDN